MYIHFLPFTKHTNLVNVLSVLGNPMHTLDMRACANGRYLHGRLPSGRTTAPTLAITIRRPDGMRERYKATSPIFAAPQRASPLPDHVAVDAHTDARRIT